MELIWLNESVAALAITPQSSLPSMLKQHALQAVLQLQPVTDCELPSEIIALQLALPLQPSPDDRFLQQLALQLPAALSFVEGQQQQGHKALMTAADAGVLGVMMANFLMTQGAAPVHAVAQVRSLYDDAFTNEGWDQFVFDVLYRMQA
ncbi:hypothetical protein PY479_08020 [Shewanella sp. A32]|uniref:hypothetical protein n=1 Tax=Shewanella sp. A32 TaxID=3031327 RepID=UPI0023B89A62|nr:hypothetical protein [Shewanella sp. A32]MDF0534217.1 hypothetical protein [Shewanella sp. A32]